VKAKYASADALSSSCVAGACNYTLEEVEAIRTELYNIQQSLSTGEQEKVELMKNLVQPTQSQFCLTVIYLPTHTYTKSGTNMTLFGF
jgi:hypothetical protein